MQNKVILGNFEIGMNAMETHIRDTYKSIAAPSEGLYKELGSRFIAKSFPVSSETEAMAMVVAQRKKYHDARHNCFAYRLGPEGKLWRASDDGEPSSSAGRPILGAILSEDLSDIVIVVTRYFGGIKLGVPGLIRAYRSASSDALANAEKVDKVAVRAFTVNFGYASMEQVQRLFKDMSLPQEERDFGLDCRIRTGVRLSAVDDFLERVSRIDGCEAKET